MTNFKSIKAAAKENLKGNLGTTLLGEVIADAAMCAGAFIPLLNTIIEGPLAVGKTEIYIKGSDHERPELEDILTGFKENFGENFLLSLLKTAFVILWTLLFIVPGIVKHYSYAMATYLITRNKELSAMEAITESRRYMNGHKFEYFLFNLSFIGWDLLTIWTLGLAGIFTVPYKNAARTEFFNRLYQA